MNRHLESPDVCKDVGYPEFSLNIELFGLEWSWEPVTQKRPGHTLALVDDVAYRQNSQLRGCGADCG